MALYSVKNQKQFDIIRAKGKKLSCLYFTIVVIKNFTFNADATQDTTFLGMKVSKKLSKKAPVRNKIKRRIRHLMRIAFASYGLNLKNIALTFIPYKNFELIEFSKLSSEFKKVLEKSLL